VAVRAGVGALVGIVSASVLLVVGAGVTAAQTSGGYASWSVAGEEATWTGSLDVATVASGPAGTLTTNSRTPTVPTGASTFLGANTPFATVFGSSESEPYLQIRYTTGTQPSTTVITFDAPTPTQRGGLGWGFALGDIDADEVTLTATTTGGAAVTAAQLGWQGAFNFCNASPRPGSCPGGAATDVPVWDPDTSTLTGNGVDTAGASGWFRPTVPLTSLTLEFTPLSGLPVFDLWVAAAGGTSLAGVVRCASSGGSPVPIEDAEVALLDGAGDPVTVNGEPLTATTGSDGAFSFDALAPGAYTVTASRDGASVEEQVDTSSADPTDVDLALPCDEPPPPTTATTTPTPAPPTTTPPTTIPTTEAPAPTSSTTASPAADHAGGSLPVTGLAGLGLAVVGGASIAAGASLALATRRRRT